MRATIDNFIERHFGWIESHVNLDGGWADQPGKRSSAITTAEAVMALLESRELNKHHLIFDGIKFLMDHQVRVDPERGAWKRENTDLPELQIPDLLRTSRAISAIARAISKYRVERNTSDWEESCRLGVEWLKQRELPGGGWSFLKGHQAEALATCFAVSALLDVKSAKLAIDIGSLQKSFDWLNHRVDTDGALGGHNEHSLRAVVTAEVLLLDGMAKEANVGEVLKPETAKRVLRWLSAQRAEVFTPVETEIVLDPINPANNYPYTAMLNATILSLFAARSSTSWARRGFKQVTDKHYRHLRHSAVHALRNVQSLQGSHGGFQQTRVFTWATCMTVLGVSHCRGHLKRMPSERGLKYWAGIWLAFFAVVHGSCSLLAYLYPTLKEAPAFKLVSVVSTAAALALGLLISYLERRPVWDAAKGILLRS
jgi:hypothetical protein